MKRQKIQGSLLDVDLNSRTDIPLEEYENELLKTNEFCWGCEYMFGPPVSGTRNPGMERLWADYCRLRGVVSVPQLAKLISASHEKNILIPAVERNDKKNAIAWPPSSVLRHFGHMHDPKLNIKQTISKLEVIEKKLQDKAFYNEGPTMGIGEGALAEITAGDPNDVKVDHDVIRSLATVAKLKLECISKLKEIKEDPAL